jgi:NAD(P)-dependent dehydrogenase (short-subunit alcohol dehydrogenase family)
MTQAQDACVLADRKPSAIVVGVGAERGLGAALCRCFAAQGHHVFVAGRTSGKIDKVAQTIAGAGGSAEAIVTDTTSEDDVARLFDRAMASRDGLNPVDLVAYNAGNNRRIDFREMTAQQFEDFWRVGASAASWSGAKRHGGSSRSAAARSSSPAPRQACAASRAMLTLRRRRLVCA